MASIDTKVFRQLWNSMNGAEREVIQAKASWEHMSLTAVLLDWPTLVPVRLRDLASRLEKQAIVAPEEE